MLCDGLSVLLAVIGVASSGRGLLVQASPQEAPTEITIRVTNADDDACTDLACSMNRDDHSEFIWTLPAVAPGATVELGPIDAPVDGDGYTTVQLRWWHPEFGQYHYSEPLRLYTVQQTSTVFAFTIPPSSGRRILIFAPHPDDETLATAGVIYYALHGDHPNHARVRVVLSTNGDAYTSAVSNYYQVSSPTASHFRNSGLARRGESLEAMARLGLTDAADVPFLNYPDQGMRLLFTTNRDMSNVLTSSYTQVNEKYDPDAFRRDSLPASVKYAGANVHQDLVAIITAERPTEVYVSDPRDTHADHAYTYLFVDEALRAAGALAATMYREVIHAPQQSSTIWPNPAYVNSREARFTPTLGFETPLGMPPPDAVFDFAVMSPDSPMRRNDITNLKRTAIDAYKSQIGWYYSGGVLVPSTVIDTRGYLIGFAKSNELFWTGGYDGPDGNDWPTSPNVQTYDQSASGQLARQAAYTAVQQDAHDVWRLPVAEPGRMRFRMDLVGSDMGLRLYAEDGVTLLASFEEPGAAELFEYIFESPGIYALEVFLQGSGTGGSYSFHDKVFSPRQPGDYDWDWDVDQFDFLILEACFTGSAVPYGDPPLQEGCTLTPDATGYLFADVDRDGDTDPSDFGIFQRCFSGEDQPADPQCAD